MTITLSAAAALLLILYAVMGGWFSCVWGIDPSRATPYSDRTGRRRGGFFRLLLLYLLPCAWLQAAAGVCLAQTGRAPADLAVYAAVGGLMSMASLFVSTRHDGEDMAVFAGEEYGPRAESAMLILAALAMTACCAALADMLRRMLTQGLAQPLPLRPDRLAGFVLLTLCGLHTMIPGGLLARRVRSERQIRSVGLGGVLLGALLAAAASCGAPMEMAALYLGEIWPLLQAALCLLTALMTLYLAQRALCRLIAGRGLYARRRRCAKALAPVLTFAAAGALSLAGYDRLLPACTALGFSHALCVLVICWVWLRMIGRGLLFGRRR